MTLKLMKKYAEVIMPVAGLVCVMFCYILKLIEHQ